MADAAVRMPPATMKSTTVTLTAEPIFAALFAFLILHEVISAMQWLGALLRIGGMVLAETDLKLSRIVSKKNY